ncbi:MAG: hypothetical protein KKA65_05685 [Nanoarchaeota archaeon]|nr:hypothetical protein [Nanoarchaeota archaeon]MBU4352443.1 hypothetical protein [Nanoarchaeota archaeon]MBU4456962.1 hypothetical protein [Nanoarchaeota archaeon]MCG2720035.1 hypothetical protein [Nanoarchaeota archaeon]
MEAQEMLKHNYHEYLRIATDLPTQMRECGVFEVRTSIGGHDLKFSHEGTIQVDETEQLALTSVDSILYACFPRDKTEFGYQAKPQNLQQVVPEHMRILRGAISEAQKSLDDFVFYKR